MMRRLVLPLSALVLAACSSEPAEQEDADGFADRIGQSAEAPELAKAGPNAPNTAVPVPPAGADLTALQQLGDIGGIDLGPRDGGCTLMVGSEEMLIAAGMRDKALPGKAVVRLGGSLTIVDADMGGLDAIRTGTTFNGEGFAITVTPAAGEQQSRPANVTVRDAAGKTQSYSGNWICA